MPADPTASIDAALGRLRRLALVLFIANAALFLLAMVVRTAWPLAELGLVLRTSLEPLAALLGLAALATTAVVRLRMPRRLGRCETLEQAAEVYVRANLIGLSVCLGAAEVTAVFLLLGAESFPMTPLWLLDTICAVLLLPARSGLEATWQAARQGLLDHQRRHG